ncbi:MAG: YihY/virulence factor BrkB family protein [Opitutaceae bacterium]|nr:YihY/virulence factor BrkB family protein [Opitutaceae bacterium]MBP9911916.1 YihY/virulence factor BrkB family protein [Opitutaceae bacterium]
MARLINYWHTFLNLFNKEIWKAEYLKDRSVRGKAYAVLRVISITLSGLEDNKAFSRAAALSFSSLLGLGPVVAIAVLVAGFVVDQKDPHLAANSLNHLIKFVAPQIAQYEKISAHNGASQIPAAQKTDVLTAATLKLPPPPAGLQAATEVDPKLEVDPELVKLIDGFVAGSRNGAAGALGALTLILIVLQLFTSVENAFNEIWGVRRGRSWVMRIVFYWTILTLGAVLFFAAVTGLSAGAFFNAFAEKIPLGRELVHLLQLLVPSLSIVLLIAVLTLFYRHIPNTHVYWRAAFVGAVVVALLLVLNNFLAFLYFRRVILSKSLYGSLGILPILMFGLYIFWFFVLLGGQVSYAMQNVRYRNSQVLWNSLAESMRERLSLIVLLTICRRFYECMPPCTSSQLSQMLKVPTQLLNECLNRLVLMKLIIPIPPQQGETAADYHYQPARPLNRITLSDFKNLDDDFGEDPTGPMLTNLDPIVARYNDETAALTRADFFQKNVEALFAEFPIDESRPPFTFGLSRRKA